MDVESLINCYLCHLHALARFQDAGSREQIIAEIMDFNTHDVVFGREILQTADFDGEIFTERCHAVFRVDVLGCVKLLEMTEKALL
jgi:hypothetical protein